MQLLLLLRVVCSNAEFAKHPSATIGIDYILEIQKQNLNWVKNENRNIWYWTHGIK